MLLIMTAFLKHCPASACDTVLAPLTRVDKAIFAQIRCLPSDGVHLSALPWVSFPLIMSCVLRPYGVAQPYAPVCRRVLLTLHDTDLFCGACVRR